MNRLAVFLLLTASIASFAQAPLITRGSTVYIESMDGYETYLAAAITKKKVPLILVTDTDKADYVITSTVNQSRPTQPTTVVNNTNNVNSSGNDAFNNGMQSAAAARAARGTTSTSISVVDTRSSQIVFAYAVGKSGNTNQVQSAAEASAKHLKDFIDKKKE